MNPEVIKYLNVIIADQAVLAEKMRNFHWNVISSDFGPLHSLFGELYDLLADDRDTLAERIRALGSKVATASLGECLALTTITEFTSSVTLGDRQMLEFTLSDFEQLANKLNQLSAICNDDNTDSTTGNMLLNLIEVYEKKCWMIRSHLG